MAHVRPLKRFGASSLNLIDTIAMNILRRHHGETRMTMPLVVLQRPSPRRDPVR